MSVYFNKNRSNIIQRIFSAVTAFVFLFSVVMPPQAAAQIFPAGMNLPVAGTMLAPSSTFYPVLIKGIEIHPDDPLRFDFIMDTGDTDLTDAQFREESAKLARYFMAALTIPEQDMWVNLSPYEKDRIIPDNFGRTEMGRDLLVQDYILKQLAASLMYPEDELGQNFWKRVHKKAEEQYGTIDIPMNTFNKVWILPQTAALYEYDKGAFIVDSRLEVMLEEDYLALKMNQNSTRHGLGGVTQDDLDVITGVTAEVVRDVLLPEIKREVNRGKHFANLRQIYNAMVLAAWYKQRLKDSLLGQVYVDQKKVNGLEIADTQANQKIYDQYVSAFKKGAYDYIKEEYDPASRQVIPKRYFSGGADMQNKPLVLTTPDTTNPDEAEILKMQGAVQRTTIKANPKLNRTTILNITNKLKQTTLVITGIAAIVFIILARPMTDIFSIKKANAELDKKLEKLWADLSVSSREDSKSIAQALHQGLTKETFHPFLHQKRDNVYIPLFNPDAIKKSLEAITMTSQGKIRVRVINPEKMNEKRHLGTPMTAQHALTQLKNWNAVDGRSASFYRNQKELYGSHILMLLNGPEAKALLNKNTAFSADQAGIAGQGAIDGGIDLNSDALEMRTENTGAFEFPVPSPQMIQNMNQATGFVPTVLDVAPITNLPMLLGLSDEPGEDDQPVRRSDGGTIDNARNEYFDRMVVG